MADIRINSLPSTATSFNTDDYIAIDGASGGTRKMLAATLPLTDVTFGSSGPSAKSSIAARAARQGLVFDGTSQATSSRSLGSIWTVPVIFTVPASNPSARATIWALNDSGGGYSNATSLSAFIGTGGELFIRGFGASASDSRIATVSGFVSSYGGKVVSLTAVQSGGTLQLYLNGTALAFTETTAGTAPAWNATWLSTFILGGNGGNSYFTGFVSSLGIYNRALSAAEVVALYEAGVPAGADYNTASNTAINTGAVANSSNVNFDYDTFTGASATGFTASVTSSANGSFATVNGAEYSVVTGTRYLVTFSATLTSGTAPKVSFGSSIVGTLSSNIHTVTAGSNSVILTLTATGSRPLYFYNAAGESASFAISSLSVTRLGLLLAPDAGQAGGGLTWYDTSGNAANITLPASGVSWNVPTSGYWGGNLTVSGGTITGGTSGLSLASGGTNQNLSITPSGTGRVHIAKPAGQDSYIELAGNGNTAGTSSVVIGQSGADLGVLYNRKNAALSFGTNGTEAARFFANGNLFIGASPVDGGQKLQVSGTASITGNTTAAGITLAVNTALYNTDATLSSYSASNGVYLNGHASGWLRLSGSGGGGAQIQLNGGTGSGATIVFNTNNSTTALTLDSSQNATFVSNVILNGATVSPTLSIRGANANASPIIYLTSGFGGGSQQQWSIYTNDASAGGFLIRDNTAGTNPLTIAKSTGDATFAGKVSLPTVGTDGGIFLTASGGNSIIEAFRDGSNNYGRLILKSAGTAGVDLKGTGTATFSGAIAIGNTVNTVSPTSPNRTITMVIGGTTYYIHAKTTND